MTYYKKIDSLVQKIRNHSQTTLRIAALKTLENKPLFDIEAASACNIACSFCPRTKLHRHSKTMAPEVFDLVLKMLPNNATVMFAGLGEPLLNEHLATYIQLLKKRYISPCIITNGILLSPERQKQLIVAGVDQLQISYSGINENTLRSIMGSTQHKIIIDKNLQYLALNRPLHLRIQLNFVLFDENQEELPAIMNLAKSWGFDIYVRRVHNRGGHNVLNRQEEENIESSCGIYAAVTFITADGKILACSNDIEEDSFFKLAANTSWEEIVAWKKRILLNKLQFNPCLKCNDDYRWLILDHSSVDKNSIKTSTLKL